MIKLCDKKLNISKFEKFSSPCFVIKHLETFFIKKDVLVLGLKILIIYLQVLNYIFLHLNYSVYIVSQTYIEEK